MNMKNSGFIQETFRRYRGKGLYLGLEEDRRYKDGIKEKGHRSEDILLWTYRNTSTSLRFARYLLFFLLWIPVVVTRLKISELPKTSFWLCNQICPLIPTPIIPHQDQYY